MYNVTSESQSDIRVSPTKVHKEPLARLSDRVVVVQLLVAQSWGMAESTSPGLYLTPAYARSGMFSSLA